MTDVCPHGRRYFEMDYQGTVYPALICNECDYESKRKARRAELVWQAVVAMSAGNHWSSQSALSRAQKFADAFLKWEEGQ